MEQRIFFGKHNFTIMYISFLSFYFLLLFWTIFSYFFRVFILRVWRIPLRLSNIILPICFDRKYIAWISTITDLFICYFRLSHHLCLSLQLFVNIFNYITWLIIFIYYRFTYVLLSLWFSRFLTNLAELKETPERKVYVTYKYVFSSSVIKKQRCVWFLLLLLTERKPQSWT